LSSNAAHLILASSSPRRAQLLREAGYRFQQIAPPYDDSGADLTLLPPRQLAPVLAYRKAVSVSQSMNDGIVLGCDTLLSLDGRAIGKPSDAAGAHRMLQELMGRDHQVVSAVYLVDVATGREGVFTETATVTIHPVEPAALEAYIRTGRWQGKAGGYNLAELQGTWRFDVQGDPTTVIGLPIRRLLEELKDFAPGLRAAQ
jgi:septum formation protein